MHCETHIYTHNTKTQSASACSATRVMSAHGVVSSPSRKARMEAAEGCPPPEEAGAGEQGVADCASRDGGDAGAPVSSGSSPSVLETLAAAMGASWSPRTSLDGPSSVGSAGKGGDGGGGGAEGGGGCAAAADAVTTPAPEKPKAGSLFHRVFSASDGPSFLSSTPGSSGPRSAGSEGGGSAAAALPPRPPPQAPPTPAGGSLATPEPERKALRGFFVRGAPVAAPLFLTCGFVPRCCLHTHARLLCRPEHRPCAAQGLCEGDGEGGRPGRSSVRLRVASNTDPRQRQPGKFAW